MINNKQTNLILKKLLLFHSGSSPSLKKSGSAPILEIRLDFGRSPLRHSGSCAPLLSMLCFSHDHFNHLCWINGKIATPYILPHEAEYTLSF